MNLQSTNDSLKRATLLNAIAKYSSVFLQIIYTAILSRILTPEEYGIVAVINVFIIFFQLFSDMGFGTGVIQNKNLSDLDINNIYSITIYIGFILMIVFIFFSFLIASFYNDNIYIPLGIELSFSILFSTFNMIPNAIMLKEKRFFSIAIRTVLVSFISFLATIVFAINGLGAYALAANAVFSSLCMFFWNEITVKLEFRIKPSFNSIKKIWGYSMFQFGSQVLNYFNRNLDNLLIGKFFSAADLGQYNKAYTLTRYPVTYLPGIITPVLHPIFSDYQEDSDYIYSTYIKVLKTLSLLGCLVCAICIFASTEIIYIVFGMQWEAAIVPFKLLSMSLWMQILTNTTAPIYQSIGNTKVLFQSTIITTVLIVTSIFIGITTGGINGVALCVSIGYIINFFISFYMLVYVAMKNSFLQFLKNFWQELIIFFVLVLAIKYWPFNINNLFLGLISKSLYLVCIYWILLVIFKQNRILKNLIKK